MEEGFFVEASQPRSCVTFKASATLTLDLRLPEGVEEPRDLVPAGAKKRKHVRALSRHPIAEQYAQGEVVVHVHLDLRGDLGGLGEVDSDDRHLCLTYQWPQRPVGDLLDSKLRRFWRRAKRAHLRPDESAGDDGEIEGFVLVSVPEFMEDPKRVTQHGRVPLVLPSVVWLRTLDDCTRGRTHEGQAPIGGLGPLLRVLAVGKGEVSFAVLREFPLRRSWLGRVAAHEIELAGKKIKRAAEVVDGVADPGGPLTDGRILPRLQRHRGEPGAGKEASWTQGVGAKPAGPGFEEDPGRLLEHLRVILFDDDGVGVATSEPLQGVLQRSQVLVCGSQFRPRVIKAVAKRGQPTIHA